jgi:hypothetical protein
MQANPDTLEKLKKSRLDTDYIYGTNRITMSKFSSLLSTKRRGILGFQKHNWLPKLAARWRRKLSYWPPFSPPSCGKFRAPNYNPGG